MNIGVIGEGRRDSGIITEVYQHENSGDRFRFSYAADDCNDPDCCRLVLLEREARLKEAGFYVCHLIRRTLSYKKDGKLVFEELPIE